MIRPTRQQITTGGLLFIAGSAFILSYDALRLLALSSGVNWVLSLLYPLVFDAVGIVAALIIVQMIEHGDKTGYAWALTIGFAILSIAGNVMHLLPDFPGLAFVVFAVPPLALGLVFHLYTVTLTNDIRRKTAVKADDKPVEVVTVKPVEVKPVVTPATGDKAERQAAVMRYLLDNPEATITQAATAVKASRQTVTKDVKELEAVVGLHKNGNGWVCKAA